MIFVDNVDAIYDGILDNDIPILAALSDEPYSLREFCIEDPIGYRLRIAEAISLVGD